MYTLRPPLVFRALYPRALFRVDGPTNTVYLTFDDGPHPTITPWVLDQLEQHNAKATFFMIGQRVDEFPEVVAAVRAAGHTVANHSHTHPDGLKTAKDRYLHDVALGAEAIGSDMYRPPYGRITPSQYISLPEQTQVVFWDVLSADFDTILTAERCAQNVLRNLRSGSIVVFHDSDKAWPRLQGSLPQVLAEMTQRGLVSTSLAPMPRL